MKTVFFTFLWAVLVSHVYTPTAQAEALPMYENEVPIPSTLTWKNSEGMDVSIENFKGKVVLLNLWATWCGPCVFEMPTFNFLQKRYGKSGFEIVAISGDDTAEGIAHFYENHNVDALKIYTDPSKIFQRAFNIESLPATYLINREGHVIAGSEGLTEWLSEEFTTQLQNTLKQDFQMENNKEVEVIEGHITNGLHR